MKPSIFFVAIGLLVHAPSFAQNEAVPVEALPVEAPPESAPPQESTPPAILIPTETPPAPPSIPGPAIVPSTPDGAVVTFPPLEEQKRLAENTEDGYVIKDASLNDIFQFLAKSAGRQYFHNVKISTPEYLVTGHLNEGNPLQQMEELAFMYGLSLHIKGTTIYALTQAQLAQLPAAEFHYQLKYLRPADMEQIKELVKPILSPGSGIVNFEPKTNTVVIIDSAHRIEQARGFLHSIDKAKGQIIVATKILRVSSKAGERLGVDWAGSLGRTGTSFQLAGSLNNIFGINPASSLDTNNVVLSPIQLEGVLRALADGTIATQISNPTLITEDNELASISIIDRIPIITSTVTVANDVSTVTDEVRYRIDLSDKSISDDPEKHREIGISLVVTPTLLPDGTIRMRMRPRSAQIVENVVGRTGNFYPRVTESMVESIARVPDGHSLVVGGFYGEAQARNRNKIPLLGDIPVLNFFFKSKDTAKELSSLVFIVTPLSYNPRSIAANAVTGAGIRAATAFDGDHEWIDPAHPGPAHEPNLRRGIRGLRPDQAPYFPRPEEFDNAPKARRVRR